MEKARGAFLTQNIFFVSLNLERDIFGLKGEKTRDFFLRKTIFRSKQTEKRSPNRMIYIFFYFLSDPMKISLLRNLICIIFCRTIPHPNVFTRSIFIDKVNLHIFSVQQYQSISMGFRRARDFQKSKFQVPSSMTK